MIGLFDRDAFIKLACCDLGEAAINCLRICNPYRLASLTPASNRRALKRTMAEDNVEKFAAKVDALCAKVPVVPNEMTASAVAAREFLDLDLPDVDIGERTLATIIKLESKGVLLTGDKKFIAAIREHVPVIWNDISHQVISFERCLEVIHTIEGFDFVKQRALPGRDCDTSLRVCLHTTSDETTFLAALTAYSSATYG